MKLPAAIIGLLAFLIAVVPFLTNCHYQGRDLLLADGHRTPAPCYWTARAAAIPSAALMGLAGLLALSWRRETRRVLTALGVILGTLVILLPTRLIGTCPEPGTSCNLILKPTLLAAGVLLVGTSLVTLAVAERRSEYAQRPGRGSRRASATRRRSRDGHQSRYMAGL